MKNGVMRKRGQYKERWEDVMKNDERKAKKNEQNAKDGKERQSGG